MFHYFLILVLLRTIGGKFEMKLMKNDYKNVLKQFDWFFQDQINLIIFVSEEELPDFTITVGVGKSFTVCSCLERIITKKVDPKDFLIIEDSPKKINQVLKIASNFSKLNPRILILAKRCNNDFMNSIDIFSTTLRSVIVFCYKIKKVIVFEKFSNKFKYFLLDDLKKIKKFLFQTDCNGYNLKAVIFESIPTSIAVKRNNFIGADPLIAEIISKKLNLTIDYHVLYGVQTYGSRYSNGTSTGAIQILLENKAEIALNRIFFKDYNAPELTFTRIIHSDRLCVVLPKPEQFPRWTLITKSLTIEILTFWLIVLLLSTLILTGIRKINQYTNVNNNIKRKHLHDYTLSTVSIDVIQIYFNSSPTSNFSKMYYERFFLTITFLFGLIIATVYQSALSVTITSPGSFPVIKTLKQLANSQYSIRAYSDSLKDTFNMSDSPSMQILHSKFKILTWTGKQNPHFGYLLKESRQKYIESLEFNSSFGTYMVSECPRNYLLGYLIRNNFPILEDYNKILEIIFETGLTKKLYHDFTRKQNINHQHIPYSYNIKDLLVPFTLLITGYCVGTIILVCEKISVKIKK